MVKLRRSHFDLKEHTENIIWLHGDIMVQQEKKFTPRRMASQKQWKTTSPTSQNNPTKNAEPQVVWARKVTLMIQFGSAVVACFCTQEDMMKHDKVTELHRLESPFKVLYCGSPLCAATHFE
jgi:hypothetical protein